MHYFYFSWLVLDFKSHCLSFSSSPCGGSQVFLHGPCYPSVSFWISALQSGLHSLKVKVNLHWFVSLTWCLKFQLPCSSSVSPTPHLHSYLKSNGAAFIFKTLHVYTLLFFLCIWNSFIFLLFGACICFLTPCSYLKNQSKSSRLLHVLQSE